MGYRRKAEQGPGLALWFKLLIGRKKRKCQGQDSIPMKMSGK